MFIQNIKLKKALLGQYHLLSQAIFWLGGSPVMVISLPKAGTHLITSVLGCFPRVMLTHRHLRLPDIHDGSFPYSTPSDFRPDVGRLRTYLGQIRDGQVASCHFPYSELAADVMRSAGMKIIFAIRDPRDIAISQVNYICKLERHPLHQMLLTRYSDFDERLLACVKGIEGIDKFRNSHHLTFLDKDMPSLSVRAAAFLGWLGRPDVLTVRFEDLVGARGGGDDSRKMTTISEMARHIGKSLSQPQLDELMTRSADTKSATFFSGKAYSWKKTLNQETAVLVTKELQSTIKTYGYQV